MSRNYVFRSFIIFCLISSFIFMCWALGSALNTLVYAFALAYFTHPLVIKLEKYKMRRSVTVILILAFSAALLGLGLAYLVPYILREAQEFIQDLPFITQSAANRLSAALENHNLHLNLGLEDLANYLSQNFQKIIAEYSKPLMGSLTTILTGTLSVIVWVLNLTLFPILFFFLIQDYDKIIKFTHSLVPTRFKPKFEYYSHQLNQVLSGYIRGQVIVASCLVVIYSLGFSISGIKFGLILGIIAGTMSLIPYVGATIAVVGSVGLALAYSAGFSVYLGIAIVISIAQTIETFYLTPYLVGNRVGLNPLATLLVLIMGANLGGMMGMLIAIPVGGMLRVIFTDILASYKKSELVR